MFEITFNYEDKYKDGRAYININSDESIITDEIRKSINNIKQEIKKLKHIIDNEIEYSITIEEHKIKKQDIMEQL
jgi:hypothetical protein